MQSLAGYYLYVYKYSNAEALFSEVLEIRRRAFGPEHPDTLSTMNELARTYYDEGNYEKAERLCSEVLEMRRRVLGPEHPSTLDSMSLVGSIDEAEAKYPRLRRSTAKFWRCGGACWAPTPLHPG